jgi:Ala-tRNA(Pro) deacylase
MHLMHNEPPGKTHNAPLPTTPEALFAVLDDLGITYGLFHHDPIYTVAEGESLKIDIPGLHCRNLFLRDKKKAMFLVVAANETAIDLKKLQGVLDCGRLSFGSADRLWNMLGIRPGSVCPFCIINDTDNSVRIILDAAMMDADIVNYHPLDNAMTIGLSPADLIKFIEYTGHQPHIVDLGPAAPDAK